MKVITSFNGVSVGTDQDILLQLQASSPPKPAWNFEMVQRRNRTPRRANPFPQAVKLDLHILLNPTSILSVDQFVNKIRDMFDPLGGPYWMNALHDDGFTPIRIQVDVESEPYIPTKGINHWVCTLVSAEDSWQAVASSTDSTNPITVTGPWHTYPVITFTPGGTTVYHRQVTLSGSAANYLTAITIDASVGAATGTGNYDVFVNGRPAPFYVTSPGTASTVVWVRADLPSTVDIFYGSSVSGSLAQSLVLGGLDTTHSTNTSWVWNTLVVSTNPQAPGCWMRGLQGYYVFQSGVLEAAFSTESASSLDINFSALADTIGQGVSANCIILSAPLGVSAINNLQRVVSQTGGTGATGFIRGQDAFGNWTTYWSGGAGTVTTNTSVGSSVAVAIGIEDNNIVAGTTVCDMALSRLGNTNTTFDATVTAPSITVGNAVASNVVTGTLSVGSGSITFNKVYADGALTIDCEQHTVSVASGAIMSPNATGIQFSDRDNLAVLNPGNNTLTVPSGCTASVTWHERYGI